MLLTKIDNHLQNAPIFFLLLLLLFCISTKVKAQTDDTLRTIDSTQFALNHSSTGIFNQTNDSRSYLLNNLLKFNIIRKRISINTSQGWIYGRQLTGLTNNDYNWVAEANLFKSVRRLYYWGLANYDKSYSLKITDRLQTGAGVGYSIFTKPSFNLVLSDGILYERTDLYDTTAYSTLRNSFRLKYRLVMAKIVTFEGTNFWQQSVFSWEDYILKFTNSISFRLKNWLSFTISATYNKLGISGTENFLGTVGFTFQRTFTAVSR